MPEDDDDIITTHGVGVTMTGPRDRKALLLPITAFAPFKVNPLAVGFTFADTTATVESERDKDFPDGYGTTRTDKYGAQHKSYSDCCAFIGAAYRVRVYLEQFGIPCEPGQYVVFHATPHDFMDACVTAIEQELLQPDYVI